MYNEYENYMKSILGYPNYQDSSSSTYFPYRGVAADIDEYESRYENMYPEIYKILRPMITKACNMRSDKEFTEDIIDEIVEDIYKNIESDIDVVNVNITTTNANEYSKSNNQSRSGNVKASMENSIEKTNEEKRSCCGNPMLKDLIKILLLNQVINNNKPLRPIKPNRPRPPFPPHYNQWQSGFPYRNDTDDIYY